MLILSRYVFRAVARQVLSVASVLLLIVVALQFARVLARAAAEHFPSDLLWMIVMWGAVQNFAVILPISLALGIVLGLGRLYENHEIAAMEACGAGGVRLWGPVAGLVISLTLVLTWLSLVYNPQAAAQSEAQKRLALSLGMYLTPRPGEFRSFGGGQVILYAAQVDDDGLMRNVFAHRLDENGESVVVARSARIARSADGAPRQIVLTDGTFYTLLDKRLRQRIVRFTEQRFGLNVPVGQTGAVRADAMPTAALLHSAAPKEIAEFQGRISLPLMALALGLIAVPLSRLQPRQGRYARAGIIILIYFVYTNLITAGQTWIVNGRTPAWLGLWWVHGVIAAGAVLVAAIPKWWRTHRARNAAARASTA